MRCVVPPCLAVGLLLCGKPGSGQHANSAQPAEKSQFQLRMESLLDRVASLPPEYKADLGFTIMDVAPHGSLSRAQKRALLEDISHSATRAQYPYALAEASSQTHGEMIPSILVNSKLDTLEIQNRAIERALSSAPQFAEQMFEEMKLQEDRALCRDADVEDVSAFYSTAGRIIEDPKIKTILGRDKESYLLSLVSNMRIPAEIAPLANLISTVPLTSDQLGQIEGSFDSALSRITASDREITAAEEDGNLTQAISLLAHKLAQAGVYRGRLLATYRSFLIRSLTPERCSDHSLDRAVVAQRFNALIPDSLTASPALALTAAELQSASTGASAAKPTASVDEQIMTKLYRIAAARAAGSTEEFRNGQPSTILADSPDVDDVIRYAVSPQPITSACPVCDFGAKGALLGTLVQLLPPGSELEKAIYAQVDFLSFSDRQNQDPVVWLQLFKQLLNASRRMDSPNRDSLAARAREGRLMPLDTPSPAGPEIRDLLKKSTNPIISAYISADDLLQISYRPSESY